MRIERHEQNLRELQRQYRATHEANLQQLQKKLLQDCKLQVKPAEPKPTTNAVDVRV